MILLSKFYDEKDSNIKLEYLNNIYNNNKLYDLLLYISKKDIYYDIYADVEIDEEECENIKTNLTFIIKHVDIYNITIIDSILNMLSDNTLITKIFIKCLLINLDNYNLGKCIIDYIVNNNLLYINNIVDTNIKNINIFNYLCSKIDKTVFINYSDIDINLCNNINIINAIFPLVDDEYKDLYIKKCYISSILDNDITLVKSLIEKYSINDINKVIKAINSIDILQVLLENYKTDINPIKLFKYICYRNNIEMIKVVLKYYPHMINYNNYEN